MYSSRKAWAAAIVAGAGAFVATLTEQQNVSHMGLVPWAVVVVTTIGAGGAVFAIDNNVSAAKSKAAPDA